MNPIFHLQFPNTEGPAPGLTFDTFVVGDSNRKAFLAARSAANNSGGSDAPLILCGGSGVGKTHLLHAIHADLLAQNSTETIKCLNADEFVSGLIQSIHAGTADRFRVECQNVDALLLDDIHFLAGKERTLEELSHILEARSRLHLCTVITMGLSDKKGIKVNHLFKDAALVSIGKPGCEVRANIVRAKAADLALPLSEEDIDLIAQHAPADLRNIHGILNRIRFYRDFPEAFPDAPSISEIICSISESSL